MFSAEGPLCNRVRVGGFSQYALNIFLCVKMAETYQFKHPSGVMCLPFCESGPVPEWMTFQIF